MIYINLKKKGGGYLITTVDKITYYTILQTVNKYFELYVNIYFLIYMFISFKNI